MEKLSNIWSILITLFHAMKNGWNLGKLYPELQWRFEVFNKVFLLSYTFSFNKILSRFISFITKIFHFTQISQLPIHKLWVPQLTHDKTEVVEKKSSLLVAIILQNTQTFQLCTVTIKTKIIHKSYKKCEAEMLLFESS